MPPDDAPTLEDLECLNWWPKGTMGHYEEQQLLRTLLELCMKHGFGRTSQAAQWIEKLWREQMTKEEFEKLKREKFEFMGWKYE